MSSDPVNAAGGFRDRVFRASGSRYRVFGEVARTSEARFFVARDEQRRRDVAIWALEEHAGPSPEKFLRAARSVAALEHPHIVTLIDFEATPDARYLVLPAAELETLWMRLQSGDLGNTQIIRIATEVADALAYAHLKGVVHGGLSSSHVLLIGDDAKLLGFGLGEPASDADGRQADLMALEKLIRLMCEASSATAGRDCALHPALESVLSRASRSPTEGGFADATAFHKALRQLESESIERHQNGGGTFRRWWDELTRRKVWQAAIWYAATALGVVEGFDLIVKEAVGAPDWLSTYLPRLALLGFPVALILAWTVERTTRGLRWARPLGTEAPQESARWRTAMLAGLGGLFFAGAIIALPEDRTGSGISGIELPDPLDPRRIAVTEVSSIADPGQDRVLSSFARFLHESLIAGLATIEPLHVRSTRGLDYADASPDSLARRLRVGTIVSPTLVSQNGSIRVMLAIIDGETGEHVRSSSLLAPADEVHSLVEPVVDSVLALLRRDLGQTIERRLRVLETEVGEALQQLLFAEDRVEAFEAVIRTPNLDQAERLLSGADSLLIQAEELDSSWALPAVRRGWLRVHWQRVAAARGDPEPEMLLREAEAFADRALSKDPNNVDALELRGWVRWRLWVEARPVVNSEAATLLSTAEADLTAAMDGNPRKARVMRILSEVRARLGDYEMAVIYAEDALEKDPYLNANTIGPILFRLFEYHFQLGADDRAKSYCEDGYQRYDDPTERYLFNDCRLQLMAFSEELKPQPDSAWQLRDDVLEGYPSVMHSFLMPRLDALVALSLARSGLPDSARATMDRALAASRPEETIIHDLGLALHAQLGDWALVIDSLVDVLTLDPDGARRRARSRELRALRQNDVAASILDSVDLASSRLDG